MNRSRLTCVGFLFTSVILVTGCASPPYRMRVEVEIPAMGMEILNGYDGEMAWEVNPMQGGKRKVTGEQARTFKEQADMDGVLVDTAAKGYRVEYAGEAEVAAMVPVEVENLEPRYAPRVISAQNAFIMRSMMREVVQRGTAVRAKALGRNDIAGKTGTTNDQIDAWFSGFNDQVVTTTWVGFDNQRKMGRRETGSRAALPMWIEFMKTALDGRPENLQEQPEGLVTIRIDAENGERAGLDTRNSMFEVFRVENAPLETLGPYFESHIMFPDRVNVGFMQMVDRDSFKLRVFERGVGETRACGSGACAAMVAGVQLGLLQNAATAILTGGRLKLEWQGEANPVMMTGETAMVYQGEIEYE